jgi:hypothetical protein
MNYLHADVFINDVVRNVVNPTDKSIQSISRPKYSSIVSAMMRYCVMAQLHLAESEPQVPNPTFSLEIQTRRRVFWSAYAIAETMLTIICDDGE